MFRARAQGIFARSAPTTPLKMAWRLGRELPPGADASNAYSVSSPTRRWNTSGLFATVRHYRVAKISFCLALAVRANSGKRRGQCSRIERVTNGLSRGVSRTGR
jgi:hypothetical protein